MCLELARHVSMFRTRQTCGHAKEKLQLIRAAPDTDKAVLKDTLNNQDRVKLWKRFEYSRKTQAPQSCQDKWDDITRSGMRQGKVAQKNELLWSWVQNGQTWDQVYDRGMVPYHKC